MIDIVFMLSLMLYAVLLAILIRIFETSFDIGRRLWKFWKQKQK